MEQVIEMEFTKAELDIIAKGLLVLNASKMSVDDELVALLNKVYKAKLPKDN